MSVDQLTPCETLTPNSPLNNLVDSFSADDDIVSGSLKPFTDVSSVSPQLLPSLDEPHSSSDAIASKTVTDTKLDAREVIDAPSDDLVLFDFSQPSLGNLETNTTESRGGLFDDDPIEYGDPFSDANYWRQQQGEHSCAVVAQISIYESLTGQYISEDAACNYAQQQGWFDPRIGTPQEYTGKLLAALGIETYQQYNASLSSLESALVKVDKPLVTLDGNEIWHPQYDGFGNPIEQSDAGHAVWVTGIDYKPNGSICIMINDSGISSGMASVVDYYDFMNAWQDYSCFVSVADHPLS